MTRDVLELGGSLGFLDELYEQFQEQPGTVDASWRDLLRRGRTSWVSRRARKHVA